MTTDDTAEAGKMHWDTTDDMVEELLVQSPMLVTYEELKRYKQLAKAAQARTRQAVLAEVREALSSAMVPKDYTAEVDAYWRRVNELLTKVGGEK